MRRLSGNEIRETFLNFFAARGHQIMPSASLVPTDPTVLLTIAGMLPFKPIFLGQQPAPCDRATTSQKCIRTNDIENVGRTARHHTFFEMLGNFSFGDYFKKEAAQWAWELVTDKFGLPAERLVVSIYEDDDDAFAIWRDVVGVPAHRIVRMGAADNFWAAGETGPCGPCSEIYYDFKPEAGDQAIDLEDDSRFLEIYNLVFMELNRDAQGKLTPLAKQNIDTGLGLERLAQILQGVPNNYETDLVFPIIETAATLAKLDYRQLDEERKVSLKVIGDHVRAVVHLISDGVTASNVGRGYILRRLIRRIMRHGRLLGITKPFIAEVAQTAMGLYANAYPQVQEQAELIKAELQREEEQFLRTLDRGEKLLAEIIANPSTQKQKQISGVDAFTLYDTYGFPVELTEEIAAEQSLTVDLDGFKAAMTEQQERAQSAAKSIDVTVQSAVAQVAKTLTATTFVGYTALHSTATVIGLLTSEPVAQAQERVQVMLDTTPFYAESGGQIGDRGYLLGSDLVIRVEDVQKQDAVFVHIGVVERGSVKLGDVLTAQIDLACRRGAQRHHTATHLLQAALRQVVGESIAQAGSLVAFDRLRFDFSCPRALTAAELNQIETLVNTWISEGHQTTIEELPIAEAKAKGAIAMFGEKYGEIVRIIDVPGVSLEFCGGTHVSNTADIGVFKLISESGVSAGVRRIEAVVGTAVLPYLNERDAVVKDLTTLFKAKPNEVVERVTGLQSDLKAAQKQIEALQAQVAIASASNLLSEAETVGDVQILVASLGTAPAEALKTAAQTLQAKLGEAAVVLVSTTAADKLSWVAAFSPAVIAKGLQAGKFIGAIAKLTGGGGGGKPNLAQAGGKDASQIPAALAAAKTQLREHLG